MRPLVALVLLLSLTAWAGVNINNSAQLFSGSPIPIHFPMTAGGWINLSAHSTDGDGLVANGDFGGGAGTGWMLHATDTYNGCGGDMDFIKGGATDDVICSGLSVPTGTWTFMAAVVTSTNVHFVMISAAGAITTSDHGDTSSFTSSSPGTEVGSSVRVSTPVFFANGSIANVFVYNTVALSDAQLKAFARFGPRGVSGPVSRFWPLYSIASSTTPKTFGEYSGNNIPGSSVTETNLTLLTGTPLNANHCPCADPWNYHH
jgi:Concanavalin A-like lectin/glucanases superfamily